MPHRRITLAVSLFLAAAMLSAESPGQRELAAGKEALARHEAAEAAVHFRAAIAALNPPSEQETLSEAWLQLGIVELTGLGQADEALSAFTRSAELSASPASAWLWASSAAEKLGRAQEAADLKARALAPTPETLPSQPASGPQPVQTETVGAVPEAPVGEQAPAPAPRPDAFQHFFGAEDRKAAPPNADLAPPPEGPGVSPPAAEAPPQPAPQAAPVRKGDAFRFFFGEKKRKAGEAKKKPAEAQDGGER